MCNENTTNIEPPLDIRQDIMPPDSNETIRSDQEINQSNCSRFTAVGTFESEDQTSCRILMSRNHALASLIKAQNKQLATHILM
jgi:hypothetical protein